jgi:hypothetical protein
VLRRIFGHKRQEAGENCIMRSFITYLYATPNIRVIKSRKMKWAWHVACRGKTRNAHNILVGKSTGKRPLRRPRHRWGIILEWILGK